MNKIQKSMISFENSDFLCFEWERGYSGWVLGGNGALSYRGNDWDYKWIF